MTIAQLALAMSAPAHVVLAMEKAPSLTLPPTATDWIMTSTPELTIANVSVAGWPNSTTLKAKPFGCVLRSAGGAPVPESKIDAEPATPPLIVRLVVLAPDALGVKRGRTEQEPPGA